MKKEELEILLKCKKLFSRHKESTERFHKLTEPDKVSKYRDKISGYACFNDNDTAFAKQINNSLQEIVRGIKEIELLTIEYSFDYLIKELESEGISLWTQIMKEKSDKTFMESFMERTSDFCMKVRKNLFAKLAQEDKSEESQ